jgi:hypothetical protein
LRRLVPHRVRGRANTARAGQVDRSGCLHSLPDGAAAAKTAPPRFPLLLPNVSRACPEPVLATTHSLFNRFPFLIFF